ncbi:WD40 repeat-like protein, partial [Nadsonia fulvescens var. elongata DSM 6958]
RFRIVTGSYEHNLLCVSLSLYPQTPMFTPIFHFTPHIQSIRCVASSKRYLVSGSNDENIRIYDLQKRKELGTLMEHTGNVRSLQFFQNKWMLSCGDDGKIFVWRTKDWEVLATLKGHTAGVVDLAIHPSGKIAISVGDDNALRLWNLMTGRKASQIKIDRNVIGCGWSDKGDRYAIAFEKKLQLYNPTDNTILLQLTSKTPIYCMKLFVLNDVEYIVTSHGNGKILFTPLDAAIAAYEATGGNKIAIEETGLAQGFEIAAHAVRVKSFTLHYYAPTGVWYLASVSTDGKLVISDLSQKDQVAVYDTGDRLNCITVFDDDVEDYASMKKRKRADADGNAISMSDYETDFSEPETDVEEVQKRKQNKKKRNKKNKATVQVE